VIVNEQPQIVIHNCEVDRENSESVDEVLVVNVYCEMFLFLASERESGPSRGLLLYAVSCGISSSDLSDCKS